MSFLSAESLSAKNSSWLALDDVALFFEDPCPNLVLTDSSTGFTDQEGERLIAWYANAENP